jgi:integrase/recombinase XerD
MSGRQRAAHPSRVKVTGPLAGYADGFRQALAGRGYHPQVIGRQARLMADLSVWLESCGLGGGALRPEVAGDFVRDRRASGQRVLASVRALGPLLGYLRSLGAAPAAVVPAPRTPAETLLAEFAGYLTRDRGLPAMSVNSYVRHARPFVAGLGEPLAAALAGLSAAQVTGFMTGHHSQWGRGTAQATVTAVRSLLRFLHAAVRRAQAAPRGRLRPAPQRGLARRGRAAAAAPGRTDHCHLRESRHRCAAGTRAAMP